jgi:RNA polymerase sigma-70 factor (ECF subfamily)
VSTGESDDARLARVNAGEESAFVALVERYHGTLTRVAALWIEDPARVEPLIAKTWRSMLYRVDRFDSQQSLKGWLCAVLIGLVLQDVGPEHAELHPLDEAAVPAERFSQPGERWEGHWKKPPENWPEMRAGSAPTPDVQALLQQAIHALPHAQRVVLVLRDVEQLTTLEVQSALGLEEVTQRQLLHQARSRVRGALEQHHDQRKGSPT